MSSDVPAFKVCVFARVDFNLNWSKWILVVDIPTQILLTMLLLINQSLLKVHIESLHDNSHQRETIYDKLAF